MLSEKKQEKLEKILGGDTLAELGLLSPEDLKAKIAQAEGIVKQAQDELEANEQYQALKQSAKDMSEGMREVKKRQKAIVQYSLHLLEEAGK